MTCECGFDCDLGSFKIADLANHDYIGVLPKERAQTRSEIESYLVPNLNLVNPHQIVFDRIFGRGNIHIRLVEFRKGRIKRGRFSTARWASDENHAVGLMNGSLEIH